MKDIYTKDEMKEVIREYAYDELQHTEQVGMSEKCGDYRYDWILSPFMMAFHMEMYDEAELLLEKMDPDRYDELFEGKWISLFADRRSNERSDPLTISMLLLAHKNIPLHLINNTWNAWKSAYPDRHVLYSGEMPVLQDYCYLFDRTGADIVDDHLQYAKQLSYLQRCCPGIIYGLYAKDRPDHRLHLSMKDIQDREGGRRKIKKYLEFMKLIFGCYRDSIPDLEQLASSMCLILTGAEDAYVYYERELREYIECMMNCTDLLLENGVKYANAGQILVFLAGTYSTWTCRNRTFPDDVRKAAFELTCAFAPELKASVGEDPVAYMCCEVQGMLPCTSANQIGCLLKYAGGYEIIPELGKKYVEDYVTKLYQDAARFEPEIGQLIEFLELVDHFVIPQTGTPGALLDLITDIGNVELLEVSLRKGLITPCEYGTLIDIAYEKSPQLLPCLLAYRASVRNTDAV